MSSKRARWRRKVYRWRVDRSKTRDEIYRGLNKKRLRTICLETLTYWPQYMGKRVGAPAPEVRFKLAIKRMKYERKMRITAGGTKR